MKPLFKLSVLKNLKSKDILELKCYYCNNIFGAQVKEIKKCLNNHPKIRLKYCSRDCSYKSKIKTKLVKCLNCKIEFSKKNYQIKKYKNHFCSRSCNATYWNTHKSKGNRRSKLEIWIENKLSNKYLNLEIHYNRKDTIKYELDIYIPFLKLSFELNGIFHYEPIYGIDKLENIQKNDISKLKACYDAKIDLFIINTSSQEHFKESTSKKYLDIIIEIIDSKLNGVIEGV